MADQSNHAQSQTTGGTSPSKSAARVDLAAAPGLAGWLAGAIGASSVRIVGASRLAGGAVQDNWRLGVEVADGVRKGSHVWVLRTDAAARLSLSLDRATEYEVICAAYANGVRCAEPIAQCAAADVIGAPFFVQGWLEGSSQARQLVRDPALPGYGRQLAGELAVELGRIHAITPDRVSLPLQTAPTEAPARHEVARLRKALDNAGEPRPALEYVLVWLDGNAPAATEIVLLHGDFRTGNYMVEDGRLKGVLDWEFAHWGDRHEDIGWLTARCWRFGRDDLAAGGIAGLEPFLAAYAAASGCSIDPRPVAYWQIMAAAKWATIAVLQGDRYRKGGEERLELALTGLMAAEMEHDALAGIKALGS